MSNALAGGSPAATAPTMTRFRVTSATVPATPMTDYADERRDEPADEPQHDPLAELRAALASLSAVPLFAKQYAAARLAGATYGLRKIALLLVLLAVVAVIGLAALVTATVLLLVGLAAMLAAPLADEWQWVGPLVVGLVGVVLSLLVPYLVIRRIAAAGRESARRAYDEQLARQQAAVGTDVAEQAARHRAATDGDA